MRSISSLQMKMLLTSHHVEPLVQALVYSNVVSKLLFTFFPPLTLNSGPWLRGSASGLDNYFSPDADRGQGEILPSYRFFSVLLYS